MFLKYIKFLKVIIRSRFVVSVNEVERRATVVNGNVEIRPMMNLNFTVDHRYVDGGRAKKIAEIVRYKQFIFKFI